jgi:glutathionylspermidine synthase
VLFYAQQLETLGLKCIVGDPLNLSLVNNKPFLLGQPIDAIYRLFPIETFWRDPIFLAYLQANLNGSFKCLNNLRGFLAQSKAILAWIWQQRHNSTLFDEAEQKIISAHLPPTYFIKDFALTDNKYKPQDFIVKEFFGREGAQVFDGTKLTETEWQTFQQEGTYIVQQRVELTTLPHSWLDAAGNLQTGATTPCVGSFLIGDKWGGCYSRLGGPITDSTAQFVPTLLQTT